MKKLLTIALIAASSLTIMSAQAGRIERGEYTGRWASATEASLAYGEKNFGSCEGGKWESVKTKQMMHNVVEAMHVRNSDKIDINKVDDFELYDWRNETQKAVDCATKIKSKDLQMLTELHQWVVTTIDERKDAKDLAKALEKQRKEDEWSDMEPAEKCKVYNTRYVQYTEIYTKQQYLIGTLADTYRAERRVVFYKNMIKNQLENIRANGCELTFENI